MQRNMVNYQCDNIEKSDNIDKSEKNDYGGLVTFAKPAETGSTELRQWSMIDIIDKNYQVEHSDTIDNIDKDDK